MVNGQVFIAKPVRKMINCHKNRINSDNNSSFQCPAPLPWISLKAITICTS